MTSKISGKFKYLALFNALAISLLICTLAMQNRIIEIGSINVCGAILVYPISYALLDVISEVYGYQYARQTLWMMILGTFIYAVSVTICSHMPSPQYWLAYNHDFSVVMAPVFRSMSFGAMSIVVGQAFNIYIISRMKILTKGRYFAVRSVLSTVIGDTATIAVAIFAIFAQRMPLGNILEIVLSELIIMYVYAFALSLPISLLAYALKKVEASDPYDVGISFNPFSLKVD